MSAKDRAYRHTKARILDGSLPGGDLITEGQVADTLAMSRTPVREAFLRLEAEGLLRLFPKRGALVVAVSPHEVEAVLDLRRRWQRVMRVELSAEIEELTGRKVIGFMSDNHLDPDLAVEVFVLEPLPPSPG